MVGSVATNSMKNWLNHPVVAAWWVRCESTHMCSSTERWTWVSSTLQPLQSRLPNYIASHAESKTFLMFQPGDLNQTQLTTSYQMQNQIFFFITEIVLLFGKSVSSRIILKSCKNSQSIVIILWIVWGTKEMWERNRRKRRSDLMPWKECGSPKGCLESFCEKFFWVNSCQRPPTVNPRFV